MAAPATPSRILPKSNFHTVNAATNARAVSSSNPTYTNASPPYQINENFTPPDHIVPPPDYSGFENLVIVCCHGIFHPDASSSDFPLHSPYDEKNWHLAPFQRSNPGTSKPGEQETFVAHALAGIDALTNELSPDVPNKTLLAFSGGPTKSSLTSLSEARSYYHAVLAQELARGNIGGGQAHELLSKGRILLEEHATDSFQNLLFSILLFRRTTGHYPSHIRVITHAFKAKRFLNLHAPAILWPAERIQVQGIDPIMSSAELEETVDGEQRYGYAPWLEDPLGTGELLAGKRRKRGWDGQFASQLTEGLEDSVKALCLGTVSEQLPWSMAAVPVSSNVAK
ncbi:hypothetical protein GRF29_44g2152842 [Pseudopithomyces chartarum]|uniref:DUF218 domain-containing protein n=1 Tax=Pseudopithomyces chartarum TaxID=1892770 RepID=A0AAN6LZB8_9PLEO|nr:hypothetical protein GRF29_44g2152842 [Pseudopithomyces chartarum]